MTSHHAVVGTTAMLKPQDILWPGPHQVTLEVRDQQGVHCPDQQVLKLDVCTCDKSATCGPVAAQKKSSVLGGAGIGLLVLGLLMLLREHTFTSVLSVLTGLTLIVTPSI